MEKSKMRATVEYITPTVALNYLKSNIGNRNEKRKSVEILVKAMNSGEWTENGESIVFNKDGVLADGQHRLMACIKANFSYNAVVVRGVDADVMSTIDIGVNRSLNDVLELNGFSRCSLTAAIIKQICAYKKGSKADRVVSRGLSNKEGLSFAIENKALLDRYSEIVAKIYVKGNRAITSSFLGFMLYVITKGEMPQTHHIDFITRLSGNIKEQGCSPSWVNGFVSRAKKGKAVLSKHWKTGVCIRAWNNYAIGNPSITVVRFDVKNDLPKLVRSYGNKV